MKKTEPQNIRLRSHLAAGALISKDLQERLSISQPALSRAIQRNRKDLLILGAARSTRYALRKHLAGTGTEIPASYPLATPFWLLFGTSICNHLFSSHHLGIGTDYGISRRWRINNGNNLV